MSQFNVAFADNFLSAAESIDQVQAAEAILGYQEAHEPTITRRFLAIYEASLHSSKKRLWVIDGMRGVIAYNLHVAHGSGSEGDSNDGYANIFSNQPNSNATSLGLYKCAETYIGKHGRSLRLDGLQSTNSNARSRAVVIHGAKYVSERDNHAGHSWGCPALDEEYAQSIIDILKLGSYLYIYARKTSSGGKIVTTLKKGSTGEDVKDLQRKLGITQDGNFGAVTEAAVKAYQKSHGLTSDGVVGPKTWEVLHNAQVPVTPLPATPSSSKVELWYPDALKYPAMKSSGKYLHRYPEGAVIHFTAGTYVNGLQDAVAAIDLGRKNGYLYMCISSDGEVLQTNPLDAAGFHAGESVWTVSGRRVNYVADYLLGIEMCNPGKLVKHEGQFFTWYDEHFKHPIDPANIRKITHQTANQEPGYYLPYTKEQELSLFNLLIWLKRNNPSVFKFENVAGHDSVAPGRKNDPGGALSMSIPSYVKFLDQKYKELTV